MNAVLLPILPPLIAALAVLLLRRGSAVLALAGATLNLAGSLWLIARVVDVQTETLLLPGLPDMPLRLVAGPMTSLLTVAVATVATFVLIYAVGYMKRESGQARFYAVMSLFLAAMQALVLAGDWILLLASWELISLCSYLLIGFWFQRPEAANAATRAFLYTRSADLGLYVAIFILIGSAGTSEIAASLEADAGAPTIAGLLLLLAAMGKSAQVPLQDWLMRAMAGPTPVSALLHSATLVAAGAILLIRSAPLLTPEALFAVGLVGGITTVAAGVIALAERDLKRVLAASTASQYGLMLIAVGAGVPLAALLHLLAHAAIKSTLFLAAGDFQHAREGTGFDQLKGVGRARPWSFGGFALAAMALAGIPPLSGFFSKDAVIAAALSAPGAVLLGALALVGTLLTGAYMARALRVLWQGSGDTRPVEGTGWMRAGIWGLAIPAAVLGLAFGPLEKMLDLAAPETAGIVVIVLGLVAALGGLALGWLVPAQRLLGPAHQWAESGLVVAGGLTAWVGRPAMAVAGGCNRLENHLYAAALGIGDAALSIARGGERLEKRLYQDVLGVGRANLAVGRWVRGGDERGIDGLIFALVAAVQALGARARSLQSGMIHHSLAISAVAIAVLFVVILFSASLSF
ncbi:MULTISPECIES: NADH-quinone oxidoreductase subunit L [Halomonadaceae]|jgi:NADH-quinone oxidoreductase subunit L|uniref:Proton-conducting transporter membrane subunit n=1 Tax=Vreelandella gomseomensis TaxID=370766 RepID=A0ABU1GFY9_9GAMM|nr:MULTISPECIES: proton-conducting transporter membrane subunit [Halomonas]MCO7246619.1 NADH-quinone oxidoreductase subunit L [Halomonas sp. Mc5H-6]MDR5876392.1 proton-conducting transporter membrane subunit [Halomonas gomseomensis]QPL44971.1 NADH-quinone oxidoreductase subunit L [Halomonas sp. A40-4]